MGEKFLNGTSAQYKPFSAIVQTDKRQTLSGEMTSITLVRMDLPAGRMVSAADKTCSIMHWYNWVTLDVCSNASSWSVSHTDWPSGLDAHTINEWSQRMNESLDRSVVPSVGQFIVPSIITIDWGAKEVKYSKTMIKQGHQALLNAQG